MNKNQDAEFHLGLLVPLKLNLFIDLDAFRPRRLTQAVTNVSLICRSFKFVIRSSENGVYITHI